MKWARIENGRVMEMTDINPEGRFHPSLVWVQCDEEVDQHYTYADGVFTAPPPLPQTTAQDLAPGRSLDGLTAEEVAEFEALADMINTNPASLNEAVGGQP